VFSLDACLSLLIVMIVVAGVARVGEAGLIYGQHGYLRLQRYANDALETMLLTNSMDNVIDLVIEGDNKGAEDLARAELQKVLPGEVQFKLVIGEGPNPYLRVYPSDDEARWENAFRTSAEVAVATRITPRLRKVVTARVLAWLDDPLDEVFMDEVELGTGWYVKRTNDELEFSDELKFRSENYNVVFIPDAEVQFSATTVSSLVTYNLFGGKLVVGGDTLKNNDTGFCDVLWLLLGLQRPPAGWGKPRSLIGQPEFNYMRIFDTTDNITADYTVGDNIGYSGENYYQYVYKPFPSPKVHVIAGWDNVPSGWTITPSPWAGIISRDADYKIPWLGWTFPAPTVLFNMRLAQSAMDPDLAKQPKGTSDWINLARRAIGYVWGPEFTPMTLYVWRGQEVG